MGAFVGAATYQVLKQGNPTLCPSRLLAILVNKLNSALCQKGSLLYDFSEQSKRVVRALQERMNEAQLLTLLLRHACLATLAAVTSNKRHNSPALLYRLDRDCFPDRC